MLRVTAAELDERRILAPARRLIARLPVAAGGGRGKLTTPARTPQVGGPAIPQGPGGGPGQRRKPVANGQDGALRRLQRAAAPRETAIQRDILAFLNATPGVCAFKAGAGLIPTADGRRVRMGKAGTADVTGWIVMGWHRDGRSPSDLSRCHAHVPDYLPAKWKPLYPPACRARHLPVWFAVEVKRPGQKATPLQLAYLARLKDAGSPLAMVAMSVAEVRRAVEAL